MEEPVNTGSEQDAKPKGQPEGTPLPHSLAWLWWLPTFVLVYVLSVGPAIKLYPALYRACPAAGPALEVIYQPLRLLGGWCPPFARAMTWYLEDVWHVP